MRRPGARSIQFGLEIAAKLARQGAELWRVREARFALVYRMRRDTISGKKRCSFFS